MSSWSAPLGADFRVRVRVTSRADGDLQVDGEAVELAQRRHSIIDRPWVWLQQVHGAEVVVLDDQHTHAEISGAFADGIVTCRNDVAIAVHSADCATVAMWSPEGVIGVTHAGWRGLEAGVIGATAAAMFAEGASSIRAYIGPHICTECYEFGSDDLERLSMQFDEQVVGKTADGLPALDVASVIAIDLERAGVELAASSGECTACEADRYWSHRARGDQQRQALVVWVEP
jgi:YfiH family protein